MDIWGLERLMATLSDRHDSCQQFKGFGLIIEKTKLARSASTEMIFL